MCFTINTHPNFPDVSLPPPHRGSGERERERGAARQHRAFFMIRHLLLRLLLRRRRRSPFLSVARSTDHCAAAYVSCLRAFKRRRRSPPPPPHEKFNIKNAALFFLFRQTNVRSTTATPRGGKHKFWIPVYVRESRPPFLSPFLPPPPPPRAQGEN